MINSDGETFTPICDSCGLELPEEWDFLDAVDAMKAKRWRLEPPGGLFEGWAHYCPGCAGRCDFG